MTATQYQTESKNGKAWIAQDEIVEAIKGAKTAIVTAHVNPDGDTLGSMLALADVLEQAGLQVDRVMHDKVPEIYEFFPKSQEVLCSLDEQDLAKTFIKPMAAKMFAQREELLAAKDRGEEVTVPVIEAEKTYDLSFSCDCGSVARLGSAGFLWTKAKTTINVDHHLSNPLYGDLNWVNPEATSTGMVISDLISALNNSGSNININSDLASLMYITLLTDTGGFRHANTNSLALSWGADLVQRELDPSYLYNMLFNQMPFRAIKVIGDALAKLELLEIKLPHQITHFNGSQSDTLKIAYTYTERATLEELKASDEDTDEIVDHIMRIKGIDMCLYLREDKGDKFKGSLRSNCGDVDCSAVAAQLNGGGHARAAGFNPQAKSFGDLKDTVLSLLST